MARAGKHGHLGLAEGRYVALTRGGNVKQSVESGKSEKRGPQVKQDSFRRNNYCISNWTVTVNLEKSVS